MKTVLDSPVATLKIKKIAGVSLLATKASNEEAVFLGSLTFDHASPLDANRLLEVWPVEVAI